MDHIRPKPGRDRTVMNMTNNSVHCVWIECSHNVNHESSSDEEMIAAVDV